QIISYVVLTFFIPFSFIFQFNFTSFHFYFISPISLTSSVLSFVRFFNFLSLFYHRASSFSFFLSFCAVLSGVLFFFILLPILVYLCLTLRISCVSFGSFFYYLI